MFQSLKRSWLVLMLLVVGAQSVFGFALQGPLVTAQPPLGPEVWQDRSLGMSLIPADEGFFDIGTPKNVGQGYRWNTRNIYYAFDSTFVNYFGSDGGAAAAVDKAFAILNSLTNLSAYPFALPDEPLNTSRINYRAQALGLIDVKSLTLSTLLSELGLAEPERYTWNIKERSPIAGLPCPNFLYLVVQRNYDPSSPNVYSSYVNGTAYTYLIYELCGFAAPPAGNVRAEAIESHVDATAATENAVADLAAGFKPGLFYTGLTRDDVAGLKYLMSSNTIRVEAVSSNSLQVVTNNSFNFLVTSNFATLYAQSLTNDPVTLQALYPGLLINPEFVQDTANVVTTNVTAYFTNFPYAPAGSLPATVVVTNYVTNAIFVYKYTFDNVVTNLVFTKGAVTTQTISNGIPPFSPVGTLPTSFTNSVTQLFSFVGGEYYLIPSNALCGFSVISTQLSTRVTVTNLVVTATNSPGVTNANGAAFTQTILTSFTNHTLKVSIPQCITNVGGLAQRQGVDKLNFIRRDYNTLDGINWPRITNTYTLVRMTNSGPVVDTFQRVVTRPDILFTAADLAGGPGGPISSSVIGRTIPNFVNPFAPAPGPGTMEPQVVITFNTVGPSFINSGPFFVDPPLALNPEGNRSPSFLYGSFDGTTNEPVVYPNWVSLQNLENQLYLQITMSGPLPIGKVGVPYSAELQVTGFQPPFTWSKAPQSPGLPFGLNPPVSTGTNTAVIAGVPTTDAVGIWDFDIQVQDSAGRTTQRNFTIEIKP